MKKPICELCGSRHMIKDGELFTCESCGTKYTTEEAQKLFVEVSDDEESADKSKSYYEAARHALNKADYETAWEFYNILRVTVPYDWEAFFFSAFCKSMQCVMANIIDACRGVSDIIEETFALIENISDKKERDNAVRRVTAACCLLSETMIKVSSYNNRDHSSDDYDAKGNQLTDHDAGIRAKAHITALCERIIVFVFRISK